jgi:hypothetical protein
MRQPMPGKLRQRSITPTTTDAQPLVGKRTNTGGSVLRTLGCRAGLAYGSNTRGEC